MRVKLPWRIARLTIVVTAIYILAVSCNYDYYPVSSSYRNVDINSSLSGSDSQEDVEAILAPYSAKLDDKMAEVLIESKSTLFKKKPESELGNFLSDVILEESAKHLGETLDFASINYGGIRSTLPEGPVNVGNIYELMPFENELVVLELRGDVVMELFERWAMSRGTPVAGASYVIDTLGNLLEASIAGQEIAIDSTYLLGLTDYVADGGDGCGMLKNHVLRHDLGIKFRDAIIDYLRRMNEEGKVLDPTLENRVKTSYE